MTKILTTIFLGLISLSLVGCSDEVNEENAAVATTEAEASDVASAEEAIVGDDAAVDDGTVAKISNAGFLDYDMVMGDVTAPVEIIEYASFTCNHCAAFHKEVLPKIKEKYVDSGKVKIIFRSFMLNGIDANVAQLTRCVPEKRYFAFTNILFSRQDNWYNIPEYMRLAELHGDQKAGQMFTETVRQEINKIARQVGLNQNKIDTCLSNKDIGEYLFAIQKEGSEKYRVVATPTIIVNGKTTLGNDYRAVEKAIEAALD